MKKAKTLTMDDGTRDFGDIPGWAMKGKINLENYDLRVEWYGAKIKEWGKKWPFLSRNPRVKLTANEHAWDLYFRDHLGGFPAAYRLFRDGVIEYLNVPEATPELFDKDYHPSKSGQVERANA